MSQGSREARRHPRAPMLGTAILTQGEAALNQVVAIDNLSAGGALVTSEVPVSLGAWVHVLLCLPGSPATTLTARVVRTDSSGERQWRVALQFERVNPGLEQLLRTRVEQTLEAQNAAETSRLPGLVVAPDNAARAHLVADLQAIGLGVLSVDTVPDAVRLLGGQPAPFRFIAVDAVSECAEGVDLLAMAHRIYPDLHCVLVGDASDPEYLQRECRFLERSAVLLRPWNERDLRRAFVEKAAAR